MGRSSDKKRKRPGQQSREPRGGKAGRPSTAEKAEKDAEKAAAEKREKERLKKARQRERQRAEKAKRAREEEAEFDDPADLERSVKKGGPPTLANAAPYNFLPPNPGAIVGEYESDKQLEIYVYVGGGSVTAFDVEQNAAIPSMQTLLLGGDADGPLIDEDVKIGTETVHVKRSFNDLERSSFPSKWSVRIPLPTNVDTSTRGNKKLKNGIHAVFLKKKDVQEKDLVQSWLDELNQ